ncbi:MULTISPECIES: nuclear transport factor 2 family protein [unclassified Bacillus (in: firmicutes)]|uniref:nuclear transport factor 2 family protein n=1 Tax=unclassified Bacillus (in: firmicutes) TaxID=185979 RepID=UPI0008E64FF4|nr:MULTISPECIES: nuclear transport factor 2 family protein [unclassified Bacillus (in: firmicutes)]SFA78008.1 SnoaL-like domain-containing protein [Bacillus sp. UNCCL13]SFQ67900.1 SnoaL-like domain-containing protein [Bacillus sp. cl95]
MEQLQRYIDQQKIISQINRVGTAADSHKWVELEEVFTDKVWLDYSSLSGIEGSEISKKDIIHAWSQFLPGFQATHHMITNHEVDIIGNEAQATSKVLALHYLPNQSNHNTWTVAGVYMHHLVKNDGKWLIDQMTLQATIIDGNNDLPQLAQESRK